MPIQEEVTSIYYGPKTFGQQNNRNTANRTFKFKVIILLLLKQTLHQLPINYENV